MRWRGQKKSYPVQTDRYPVHIVNKQWPLFGEKFFLARFDSYNQENDKDEAYMTNKIEADNLSFLKNGGSKRLLIDGAWVPSAAGEVFDAFDPATGRRLTTLSLGSETDVDLAVAAARRTFEGPWRGYKPMERQKLLLRLADLVESHFQELAIIESLDMGAPVSRTLGSERRILGQIRFYAGLATATRGETIENSIDGHFFSYTVKEPLGVIGAIIPWNSPLLFFIWKVIPAVAAGCTVVLKPAEQASLSSLRMGELFLEAGFPKGVLNIVTGLGEAGAALSRHPGVDKVTFTGSTRTGQDIIKASAGNIKRLSLELGGKSPDIVFADADLDAAVQGAATAVFANSGQMCIAGSRLFVERPVYDEFVSRVAAIGKKLVVGNPLDPKTDLGPLISSSQLERVLGYMAQGENEGARALLGGKRLAEGAFADGHFVAPTVFTDVDDCMAIAREEIFGPVISAMPFDDIDEVIRRANDTSYGLGGGVWTGNIGTVHRVAGAIRAGTVWVNCYLPLDPAVPFGGYKMSGYGREAGAGHIEEFMNTKAVILKTR